MANLLNDWQYAHRLRITGGDAEPSALRAKYRARKSGHHRRKSVAFSDKGLEKLDKMADDG